MLRAICVLSLTISLAACQPSSAEEDPGRATAIDLPSASEGSSGEPGSDTGEIVGSSSSDTSDEDALLPACQDRDPQAKSALSVIYGAWGQPDLVGQPARSIVADCFVQSSTWAAGVLHLGIACTEDQLIDQLITADIDLSGPPQTMLPPGAKVYFSGGWSFEPGGASTEHFVIYDALGRLRLAALRDLVEDADTLLGPLQLARVTDTCPWLCPGDCAEGGDPSRRDTILVTHAEGPAIAVLDGQRGNLAAGNMHYTITVGSALATVHDHLMTLHSSLVIVGQPGA